MSFGARVPYVSTVMPGGPARRQCAMRVPGGRATTWPARSGTSSRAAPRSAASGDGHSSSVASPSRTTNTSSSSEWQCGTASSSPAGMRDQCSPARIDPAASASAFSPGLSAWSGTSSTLTMPAGRGDGPRVVVAALDPRPAHAHRARAGQPGQLRLVARAVDQHVEALLSGAQRVLLVVGDVDDAVAGADLVHLAVLPGEPVAAQDVDDLLGDAVRVRRRRQPARVDAHPVHADADRARGVSQALPLGGHLALLQPVRLDVVPVGDSHRADSASGAPSAGRTTFERGSMRQPGRYAPQGNVDGPLRRSRGGRDDGVSPARVEGLARCDGRRSADQEVSRVDEALDAAADRLEAFVREAERQGGLKAKVGAAFAEDPEFLRRIKPRLVAARARGRPAPPAAGPSTNGNAPAPEPAVSPEPPRTKRSRGGPNPWLVIGAAFAAGVLAAKVIDWRGHAHPRR